MKITGIICEYNPLHNGHIYHIKKTRENGATHIVAVMSGSFVQRGETAVTDKFERAALAVRCGADLVIEIPVPYSLASAEYYARGAVWILDSLGCVNELSFGSEIGSAEELEKAAEMALECQQSEMLLKLLENGLSYPNALTAVIYEKYGSRHGMRAKEILASPNNVLAVEYLKAIKHFGSDIKPFTVRRVSAMHDSDRTSDSIASASFVRKCMAEGTDFSPFVPPCYTDSYRRSLKYGRLSDMRNLERAMIYKLRTISAQELADVPDVGQGLENRILDCAPLCSIEEIVQSIKTKRYTMARIRRILLNMLLGIKKSDLEILPPYARVLAINDRGRDILAEAKKKSEMPVSTSLAKLAKNGGEAERFAQIEGTASDIYALSLGRIGRGQLDYKTMIKLSGEESEDIKNAEEDEELDAFFGDE